MSIWREGKPDSIAGVHFLGGDSRENLSVGQLGFEKSEVPQVTRNHQESLLNFPLLAGHLLI